MANRLFGRAYSLVVGQAAGAGLKGNTGLAGLAFDVSDLDIWFQVKKSLKPEPNTADIKVYGLAESTRKTLESPKKLVVRLEAGYEETGTSQIYLGEIRAAYSVQEASGGWCTHISTGDGEALKTARIKVSMGAGTSPDVALDNIVRALGVAPGNAARAAQTLRQRGLALFGKGVVLTGPAARCMTDFCKSAGLEWSIQDGQVQVLNAGKVLDALALYISPSSGLIGSPTIDSKGVLEATCLMIPGLNPGAKIVIDSASFKGGFRLQQVEYTGDTAGQEWYAKIWAKKYT